MRIFGFHPKKGEFDCRSRASLSTTTRSFAEFILETKIQNAESIINKWIIPNEPSSSSSKHTSSSSSISLFQQNDREEAVRFIKCVNDLQKSMHLLASSENSSSETIINAQSLMQTAMEILQKEFYRVLSTNRARLDPESVRSSRNSMSARSSSVASDCSPDHESPSDAIVRVGGDTNPSTEQEEASAMAMAMDDLRSIAECMIFCGYAEECIRIYKVIRKSIVDEGIYRLGVKKMTQSQVNRTEWKVLELKIKSWLEAVKISVTSLFAGERILCDHVFGASESITESCFAEISRDGASILFGAFPQLIAKAKIKKTPERIFRTLDIYSAIAENWQKIQFAFSYESTSNIRSQALESLIRLSESVKSMLSYFESKLQKDTSKPPFSGCGVHALTLYAMNYVSFLADYSNVLGEITADWTPELQSPLLESYFNGYSEETPAPAFSARVAWLILILLCKIDAKSEHYKDTSISYLFLANNLHFVLSRVRSSNLQNLLGEEWISKHEIRTKQFVENYEKLAWGQVLDSLPPEDSAPAVTGEEVKEVFKNFNASFEEAYRRQSSSILADTKLGEQMKDSIGRKMVGRYRAFYEKHKRVLDDERNVRLVARYKPDDVENYLCDLFSGSEYMEMNTLSLSSSSSISS